MVSTELHELDTKAVADIALAQWFDNAAALLGWADKHGSGLAAIAAFIGIPLVLWQIFQGAWQEQKRAEARRYAALASLPITLSGINSWAKQVASSLKVIYPWVHGQNQGLKPPHFTPPPSADQLIIAIERMIEAAPGDRIGRTLAAIVSDMQVVISRLGEDTVWTARRLKIEEKMIDSNLLLVAQIYARAASLYVDARSLSEGLSIDYSEVARALSIMEIRDGGRPPGSSRLPTVHQLVADANKRALARRPFFQKWYDAIKSFGVRLAALVRNWFNSIWSFFGSLHP